MYVEVYHGVLAITFILYDILKIQFTILYYLSVVSASEDVFDPECLISDAVSASPP